MAKSAVRNWRRRAAEELAWQGLGWVGPVIIAASSGVVFGFIEWFQKRSFAEAALIAGAALGITLLVLLIGLQVVKAWSDVVAFKRQRARARVAAALVEARRAAFAEARRQVWSRYCAPLCDHEACERLRTVDEAIRRLGSHDAT